MALVFAPEPPLDEWLHELDEWSKRSPGYFVGRPIILDVTALPLDKAGLAALIGNLSERDIRIMGVEGTKASWLGLGMPPLINGGRQSGSSDFSDPAAPATSSATAKVEKAEADRRQGGEGASSDRAGAAKAGRRRRHRRWSSTAPFVLVNR